MRGQLLKKIMPGNNSCLFASVYYGIAGIDDPIAAAELRKVVARELLGKPDEYSELILGKPPKEYANWICQDQSWGGAIELKILAEYYCTEIVIINSQTATLTRFGEDRKYDQRIFVYYDGIHYDAIYWESTENPEDIMTSFPTSNSIVMQDAQLLANQGKAGGKFTDLANFTLRCLQCNTGLVGQKEAVAHAKETGHINFDEVRQS